MLNKLENLPGFLLAIGLFVGFSYAAWQSKRSERTQPDMIPDLAFTPNILDFGQVGQQQTLTGEFELRNSFAVPLTISLISPSCACAAVELEPKRIEPNQTAKLKVAWKTGTRRDLSKDQIMLVGTLDDERRTTIQRAARVQAKIRPDL